MSEIRCLENYKKLKLMLMNGKKGDADYFSEQLQISKRSFHRLIKYINEIEPMCVKFCKLNNHYYLD